MEQFRFAKEHEKEAIKALWNQCFPREEDFTEYVFSHLFSEKTVIVGIENGKLLSCMHCFSVDLSFGGRVRKSVYFYGICTNPEARQRGIASRMIAFACNEMRNASCEIAFLIPAGDSLFGYYAKLGFAPAFYRQKTFAFNFDNNSQLALNSAEDFTILNGIYTACMKGCAHVKRSLKDWQDIETEAKLAGGSIQIFENKAYAVTAKEQGHLFIKEAFTINPKIDIISAVMREENCTTATVFSPAAKKEGVPFAVAKLLNGTDDIKSVFLDSFYTFQTEGGSFLRPYLQFMHS